MKSQDEIQAIEEQQAQQQEPGRKAVEYIEEGIRIVLASLGIDSDDPKKVKQMQYEQGIHIFDSDQLVRWLANAGSKYQGLAVMPDLAPHLQGFYIMRAEYVLETDDMIEIYEEPRLIPIAFVGNAMVSGGHVTAQIQDFRTNKTYAIKGVKCI